MVGVYDVQVEVPVEDLLACAEDEVGKLLRLDEVVGKGAFASVWRARFGGHVVACKVLQPRGGTVPPAPIVRLFIRECSTLMSMDHTTVIRCMGLVKLRKADIPELGLNFDTYGMLLEFCEGGTLKDLLMAQLVQMRDQYSVWEALTWLAQVASALTQFHNQEAPIIHRDIKPENVLLQAVEVPPDPAAAHNPTDSGSRNRRQPPPAPRFVLEAKLADLGLGVRVGEDRSVLVRRRTTPFSEGTSVHVPGLPTAEEDIEVLLGTLGAGDAPRPAGPAAAATATAAGPARSPFMGFTTIPLMPSKRHGSNRKATSFGSSNFSMNGTAGAAAAAGATPASTGGASPSTSASGTPPAEPTAHLHKLSVFNSIRRRFSGHHDSLTAVLGGASSAEAPNSGGGGGGGTTFGAGGSPSGLSGAAAAAAVAAALGRPHASPPASPHRLQISNTTSPSRPASKLAGVRRSSEDSDWPNPFRDAAIADAPPNQSGGSGPAAANPAAAGDAAVRALLPPQGATPDDYAGGGGGVAEISAAALVFGHLGGAPPQSLPPISERSCSADDAVGLASSDSQSSGTSPGLGSAQQSLVTSASKGMRNPLYTIQEPDDGASQLPSSLSAQPPSSQPHHSNIFATAAATLQQLIGGLAHAKSPSERMTPGPGQPLPGEPGAEGVPGRAKATVVVAKPAQGSPGAMAGVETERNEPPGKDGSQDPQRPNPNLTTAAGAGQLGPAAAGHAHAPAHQQQQQQQQRGNLSRVPTVSHGPHPLANNTSLSKDLVLLAGSGMPCERVTSTGRGGGDLWHVLGAATASRGSRQTGGTLPRMDTTASSHISRAVSKERGSMGLSALMRPNLRELTHVDSLSRAMRRVGSLLRSLNQSTLPKFKPDSQYQWVYGLTGQAGSCMYMAPEVFRGEPYNEKVDVYSFGVMMFELLSRELLLIKYMGNTNAGQELGIKDPPGYARKVSEGFRPPRNPRIPEAMWQLIQVCWHPDPLVRPDMSQVRTRLEAAVLEWDWQYNVPGSVPTSRMPALQPPTPTPQTMSPSRDHRPRRPHVTITTPMGSARITNATTTSPKGPSRKARSISSKSDASGPPQSPQTSTGRPASSTRPSQASSDSTEVWTPKADGAAGGLQEGGCRCVIS